MGADRFKNEDAIAIDWDSKAIGLDVYAEDSQLCFDLEIQTTNPKNLPQRARYYQGLMDVGQLKSMY